MQRITITMDDDLLARLDGFMEASGASNRSEAMRDLLRRSLSADQAPDAAMCYGVISYAMDHSKRDLARRLPMTRLDRHDQTVAALSVPVDHGSTLEIVVMKAPVDEVSTYANGLFLERGVMEGQIALIPLTEETSFHTHGDGTAHSHTHMRIAGTV